MDSTLFKYGICILVQLLLHNNLSSQLSCSKGTGIYINQVLPDPNSTSGNNFDTDCDGIAETQDEFAEICNGSMSDIDIGDYVIYDDGGNSFIFPSPTLILSGQCIVIINSWASPVTQPGNLLAGLPSLSNSGDQILLFNPGNNTYVSVVYNNQSLVIDPAIVGATSICDEDFGNDTDGESLTINGSGPPTIPLNCTEVLCAILTPDSTACEIFTADTDTYTAYFTYLSTNNSSYSVVTNNGTVTPNIIAASGTIIVNGAVEGQDVTVTITNPEECEITASIQSSECYVIDPICPIESKINEFHYDNNGNDVNEFVEIAIPLAVDPSQIQIDLYNGNDGSSYNSHVLSTADYVNSDITFDYYVWNTDLQNGPDGIAISCLNGTFIDFISYEGTFTATDGPAIGELSNNILVSENNSTAENHSIQCDTLGAYCVNVLATPGETNNCSVPCPDLLAQADAVNIINSICSIGSTNPSEGSIKAIACPNGSTAEYSLDKFSWLTTLPIYNQLGPAQTISTRCNCEGNVSPINSNTTVPGICETSLCEAEITRFPFNANIGQCDCSSYPNSFNVSVQANANANGFTLIYVIVDSLNKMITYNPTGNFPGLLGDGSDYTIYVFNVENNDLTGFTAELSQLLNIHEGDPILSDGLTGPFDVYCYDSSSIFFNKDCGCDGCPDIIPAPIVDREINFCEDDEILIQVRSDEIIGKVQASTIFFSEYLEGNGFNKCLEIFNGTGSPFDLSGWTIQLHNNGNNDPSNTYSFPLGLIIPDNDVLVICHSGSDASLLSSADIVTNGPTNFNGDDVIVLVNPIGEFNDVIGQLGAPIIIGQDQRLIRKCGVISGDTISSDVFIPTEEWERKMLDEEMKIGSHTFCGEGNISAMCTFNVYLNNPLGGANPIITGLTTGFNSADIIQELIYPQDIYIICVSPDSCKSEAAISTLSQFGNQALSCHDQVQISLGQNCNYIVEPEILLSDDRMLPFNDLLVTDKNGDTIINDSLYVGLDGEILDYKLTDICSGNNCWGKIKVDVNNIPKLHSPCEYLKGEKLDISESIDHSKENKYNIEIENQCQDLQINISADLKYACGINDWCTAGLTIKVKKGNDLIEQHPNITDELILIANPVPGVYSIIIDEIDRAYIGSFDLTITATDCIPIADCYLTCGVNRTMSGGFTSAFSIPSGGFLSLAEARTILNSSCFKSVSNLKEKREMIGDFCVEGELNIITYLGEYVNHEGIKEEIELITQSYIERKLPLQEIKGPNNLLLPCGFNTNPDSIYNYFYNGDPKTDSIAISNAFPYILQRDSTPDSFIKRVFIKDDTITSYYLRRIDTIEVERYINGEWLILDKVRKELVDTFEIVKVQDSVFQLETLLPDGKFCDYAPSYSDLISPTCGQGVKIVRQWTIIDWCDESITELINQQIENGDREAPKINAIRDSIISIEPFSCYASFNLPRIISTDNCSSDNKISVKWQSIGVAINENQINNLQIEDSPITIIATVSDECHNRDTISFKLYVEDLIAPIAICQDELAVSITEGKLARVYSESFNMGSSDNGCGNIWTKVIRHKDLRGTNHGFWNTKGPNRSPDFSLQPEPSFLHKYACNNEDGDDFKAVFIDSNSPINSLGVQIPKILSVDIGQQVWFDDYSSFCCDDIGDDEIYVVLRVFDKDPGSGPIDPRRMTHQPAGPILVPDRENVGSFKISKNEVPNDLYGHFTDCWVKVNINNKLIPQFNCEDVTVTCFDDIEDVIDPIKVNGICGSAEIILINEEEQITGCGLTSVTREYILDNNGDGLLSIGEQKCSKTIRISQSNGTLDPYTIKWPMHYDGTSHKGYRFTCENDSVVARESIIEMEESINCRPSLQAPQLQPYWCVPSCSLIGYSTQTDTIKTTNSCLSLIINHTIIDWCVWNANGNDPDEDSDLLIAIEDLSFGLCDTCHNNRVVADIKDSLTYISYKSVDKDGYYSYSQVIKIKDDIRPTIDVQDTLVIDLVSNKKIEAENTCSGTANILAVAMDYCGDKLSKQILLNWDINIFQKEKLIAQHILKADTASIILNSFVPGDEIRVEWNATDACGNKANATSHVQFKDGVAPIPICLSSISTGELQSENQRTLLATDFDLGSYDYCSDVKFSLTDRGAKPVPPSHEAFDLQTTVTLNCLATSEIAQFDLWVWDASGNSSTCEVQLLLNGECKEKTYDNSIAQINGNVFTENGQMVDRVEVSLSAELNEYPLTVVTSSEGQYSFINNPIQFAYDIRAYKNDAPLNGVSTADLVNIQRHILAQSGIDSPYKIIAADINNDQKITASDIIALRNVILGLTSRFPNNLSWRFVNADLILSDTESPWPFSEGIFISELLRNKDAQDFIGIKIGDLNDDVVANSLVKNKNRTLDQLSLLYSDISLKKDQVVDVAFSLKEPIELKGFQFTLNHSNLDFIECYGDAIKMSDQNIAIYTEQLGISWDGEVEENKSHLFSISFRAKTELQLSDMISISSDIVTAEAYKYQALELHNISLQPVANQFKLHQNYPNPFTEKTNIGFRLADVSHLKLSLYAIDGTKLYSTYEYLDEGYHEISITKELFPSPGIYIYKIETSTASLSRKMILLD